MEKFRDKVKATSINWGDSPPTVSGSLYSQPVTDTRTGSSSSLQEPPHRDVPASDSEGLTSESASESLVDFELQQSLASPLVDTSMNRIKNGTRKSIISSSDWSLESLLKMGPRFLRVPRMHAMNRSLSTDIDEHEQSGTPFIIEGWQDHPEWPKDMFNIDWFSQNGKREMSARNVHDSSDVPMLLPDFIEVLRSTSTKTEREEQVRLYGKDLDCPKAWTEWLHGSGVVPNALLHHGPNDLFRLSHRTIETLMCYIGTGNTFTPCHKDLCASSGQNLMCYAENGGSSFWFMTTSSSAPKVSEYFHKLKQELDLETHVITVEELAKAPFDVYIAEQKVGDMVYVPPRSCHQVVNHGGITIKSSWSRMTLKGLTAALYHELPIYKRVCRPEVYQVKAMVHYTLLHYTSKLQKPPKHQHQTSSDISALRGDLSQLLGLFDDILAEEYCKSHDSLKPELSAPQEHSERITCDFCGADVFQSFFECKSCISEGLIICPSCYVEGRSCRCEVMQPMQCRSFRKLLDDRNKAAKILRRSPSTRVAGNNPADLTEEDIQQALNSGQRSHIFEAACTLQQIRANAKGEQRSCTVRHNQPSHLLSSHSVLACKKCHLKKCYAHVLEEYSMHAAEAILAHAHSEKSEHWHQNYKTSDHAQDVSQKEEQGIRPDMPRRLAEVAASYSICQPINVDLTKEGWYDKRKIECHTPLTPEKRPAVSQGCSVLNATENTQNELSSLLPVGSTANEPPRMRQTGSPQEIDDQGAASASVSRRSVTFKGLSDPLIIPPGREFLDAVEIPEVPMKRKKAVVQAQGDASGPLAVDSSVTQSGDEAEESRSQDKEHRASNRFDDLPLGPPRKKRKASIRKIVRIPLPPASPSTSGRTSGDDEVDDDDDDDTPLRTRKKVIPTQSPLKKSTKRARNNEGRAKSIANHRHPSPSTVEATVPQLEHAINKGPAQGLVSPQSPIISETPILPLSPNPQSIVASHPPHNNDTIVITQDENANQPPFPTVTQATSSSGTATTNALPDSTVSRFDQLEAKVQTCMAEVSDLKQKLILSQKPLRVEVRRLQEDRHRLKIENDTLRHNNRTMSLENFQHSQIIQSLQRKMEEFDHWRSNHEQQATILSQIRNDQAKVITDVQTLQRSVQNLQGSPHPSEWHPQTSVNPGHPQQPNQVVPNGAFSDFPPKFSPVVHPYPPQPYTFRPKYMEPAQPPDRFPGQPPSFYNNRGRGGFRGRARGNYYNNHNDKKSQRYFRKPWQSQSHLSDDPNPNREKRQSFPGPLNGPRDEEGPSRFRNDPRPDNPRPLIHEAQHDAAAEPPLPSSSTPRLMTPITHSSVHPGAQEGFARSNDVSSAVNESDPSQWEDMYGCDDDLPEVPSRRPPRPDLDTDSRNDRSEGSGMNNGRKADYNQPPFFTENPWES